MTDLERFMAHVVKTDGCWLWNGKDYGRYGTFRSGGCQEGTHRAAYRLLVGPFDPTLWVLHRCDVPPCVNPSHLFLGNRSDNVRDAFQKGRMPLMKMLRYSQVGERNTHARLTVSQVLEIRALLLEGEKQASLATQYGVTQGSISRIGAGTRWTSIP